MEDSEASILFSNGAHLASPEDIRINFSQEYDRLRLPEEEESSIEEVWKQRTEKNGTLYNGSKFRMHSIEKHNSSEGCSLLVTWNLGMTCYKDFLGTNWSPRAANLRQLGVRLHGRPQAFMADPLGVGALVVSADGRAVLLHRSLSCGEAAGDLDVPGGHPEPDEIVKMKMVPSTSISGEEIVAEVFESILREIRDETNIPLLCLYKCSLMGITANELSFGRLCCQFLVRCSLTAEAIKNLYSAGVHAEAEESTALQTVPVEELLLLRHSSLWSQLAPNAKGCIMLYADHVRAVGAQGQQ